MLQSGCTDVATVRQLLYNNCGNFEAAVEDLLALAAPCPSPTRQIPEKTADNDEANSTKVAARKKNVSSRKQSAKAKKLERKRASEERKKSTSGHVVNNSSTVPDADALIIRKVHGLNI